MNTLRARLVRIIERRGGHLTEATEEALDTFLAILHRQHRHRAEAEEQEELEDAPITIAAEPAADADVEGAGQDVGSAGTIAIDCPHCGERIDLAVDLSGDDQDDIQDCSVCCCPIRIAYSVHDGRMGPLTIEPG